MSLVNTATQGFDGNQAGQLDHRYLKALTAIDMGTAVERERQAIVAANPNARLISFEMSGGGAGAIFVCQLGFEPDGVLAAGMPLLSDCTFGFIEAGEPAELVTETTRQAALAGALGFSLFGQSSAGGGAGARFMAGFAFASNIPSAEFVTQANWFINADTGDDTNDGATSATAIKTWAELARRWGPSPVLSQTTTVTIETDLPEILTIQGEIFLQGTSLLKIIGVAVESAPSTLTGVTALNAAGQQRLELSDTGLGAAGLNQAILMKTGVAAGGVAWGAETLAADDLACSPMVTYDTTLAVLPVFGTPVTPGIGDTYVTLTLPEVEGLNLRVNRVDDSDFASVSALLNQIRVIGANANVFSAPAAGGQGSLFPAMVVCDIEGFSIEGSTWQATGSRHAIFFYGGVSRVDACLSVGSGAGVIGIAGDAQWFGIGNTLVQGEVLQVLSGGLVSSQGAAAFAVFGGADGVRLLQNSRGAFEGLVWGTGNTDVGIDVQPGAVCAYRAASKPIITGTAGDTRVAGALTAYAAVPVFNPTTSDAAGIVTV